MNFCTNCQNMLYIQLKDDNKNELLYYCRNCDHKEPISNDNLCVSKSNLKHATINYENTINRYTKLDPTLPRSSKIKCPNEDCICNTDNQISREVIYIRYDDTNVKYIYLCSHCDTVWKTDTPEN